MGEATMVHVQSAHKFLVFSKKETFPASTYTAPYGGITPL